MKNSALKTSTVKELKDTLAIVNEILNTATSTIERANLQLIGTCLVSHNFIVQVGGLTVTTKGDKNTITTEKDTSPSQFNQSQVDVILTVEFFDGNGDLVTPEVYPYKEWYSNQKATAEVMVTDYTKVKEGIEAELATR